jgi:hypothetical protein
VKYVDREEPKKPERRGKGASGEEPVAKKRKMSSADIGSSKATSKVLVTKPPRPPPKVMPKKGNRLTRYLRNVSSSEMCSESFLRELEETVSLSPLRGESMELYLDQFGSLLSDPDSVGEVVVKLNPSSSTSLRSVSLLDFDEEGANIDPIVPVGAAGTGPNPVPSKVDARVAVVPAKTSSAQHSEAPGGSGEKTDAAADVAAAAAAAAAETREGFARAEAGLMGDDSCDEGQYCFNDLGAILLPRPVNFQGPDIDPYLPWVCEVDVATMMATLNHEIEFGSTEVPLPSQTASAVEGQQMEKEVFDVEGNFVCFGEMCVVGCVTAMLFVGFQKELEAYGTGDLGRVVAAMNAKALVAGRVLLRRAKAESDKMLEGSTERLKLVTENDRLKKEIAILQNLDDLRKKQIEDLEEKVRG